MPDFLRVVTAAMAAVVVMREALSSLAGPQPLGDVLLAPSTSVGRDGPGAMNIHRSNTLVGTCFGLSAGAHTIEVHRVLVPAHTPGDFHTGWRSHCSIEAEEVR